MKTRIVICPEALKGDCPGCRMHDKPHQWSYHCDSNSWNPTAWFQGKSKNSQCPDCVDIPLDKAITLILEQK